MAELVEMPFRRAYSCLPKEPCTRWELRPPREGAILGVVRPTEKRRESLLWCMKQKGSFSHQ